MKLNNKGFAISSIMYIILVLAVILISLILVTLSSRKLILDKLREEVLTTINDAPNITYRQTLKQLKSEAIAYMTDNSLQKESIKVEDLGSSVDSEVLSKYKLNDKYLTAVQNTDSYNVYLGKASTISNTTELPKNTIDIIDYKVYGESVQEGENLFDISTMSERIYAYIYDATNWVYASDSYSIRVPVASNTTYKVSIENSVTIFRVGCIEHEDIPIEANQQVSIVNAIRQTDNTPITITTTENTKYLVIQSTVSTMETTLKNLKVVQTVPKPDAPIEVKSVGQYDEITGKYKIPVISRGKNLCSNEYYYANYYGNFNIEDGVVTTIESVQIGFVAKVKPNTRYTVQYNCLEFTEGTSLSQRVREYSYYPTSWTDGYLDKMSVNSWHTTTGIKSSSFTTGENTEYILFGFYASAAGGGGIKISNFQVEEGKTATDYEPYVEPITTNIYLDEPLRKIGDYIDNADFKSKNIVRKIVDIKLTGNFTKYNDYIWQLYTGYVLHQTNQELITHFKLINSGSLFGMKNKNNPGSYIIASRIEENMGMTLDQFNNWIDENDVHYYAASNEQMDEPKELPRIQINEGATEISIDTSIAPSSYEFTVVQKIIEI